MSLREGTDLLDHTALEVAEKRFGGAGTLYTAPILYPNEYLVVEGYVIFASEYSTGGYPYVGVWLVGSSGTFRLPCLARNSLTDDVWFKDNFHRVG